MKKQRKVSNGFGNKREQQQKQQLGKEEKKKKRSRFSLDSITMKRCY